MSGADPSETASASDEVIDAIADIELRRRETEKEAGFAMSCSSALQRLQELLDHETEALRLRGPHSGHQENVQAVTVAIGRVKGLSAIKSQNSNSFPRKARTGPRQVSWRNVPRNPARNTRRRTMGRTGGR
jgi:acetyl-CoA carboxylase carboxyltransferase component